MGTVQRLLLCSLLGLASMQAMACYTVFDSANRVVYQGEAAPVDMSLPLHQTVPASFPGGHMVFDAASVCPGVGASSHFAGRHALSSPLLTDSRSARAMRLPYTEVGNGIAMIQPRDAQLAAGVTVVPAEFVGRGPSTAAMGAGPARGAVITELRDPPLIIEELNGRIVVRERKR